MLLKATTDSAPVSVAQPLRLLVLCTGNSARSIMAEALFSYLGAGRVCAYSAGSRPVGQVNPFALEQLDLLTLVDFQPRSKSWDEFTRPGLAPLDAVVTVCANAAGETCPAFAGEPALIHWGLPDPAAVSGDAQAKRAAFATCFAALQQRIRALAASIEQNPNRSAIVQWMQAQPETLL